MEYKPEFIVGLHSLGLDHLIIGKDPDQILAAFRSSTDADEYWADPAPSMSRAEIVESDQPSSPSDPWKGLTVKEEEDANGG